MESEQKIAEFRASSRTEMERKLQIAMGEAFHRARVDRTRGVLLTRHGFDHFSVPLSRNVPFGSIHEDDQVTRNQRSASRTKYAMDRNLLAATAPSTAAGTATSE